MLEQFPYYVQVAFAESEVLADRNRQAQIVTGIFLLLGIPVLAVLLRLGRSRIREQAANEKLLAQQRRLEESEQRFRDYSTASSDWLWEMDADLRFSYFSDRAEIVLGVKPQMLLGRRRDEVADLDDLEQRDKWEAHFKTLAAHQAFRNFEYHVRNELGGRWFSVSGVPVVDAQNRFCGYRGTGADITPTKHAEASLRRAEVLLLSAINTIEEPFVIYDQDDCLYLCNEQYRKVYASSTAAIQVGNTFEAILRYGLENGQYAEAIGCEEEWLARRLTQHHSANTDLIQPLNDGRWLRILERRTPEGFIVGFRIDVTLLMQAKQAAEAASIAKSRFLATMSHEIRTPMNGILGMAQMLLVHEVNDSERRDFARTILNCGQGLLNLLNDILDYSKVEAGKLELEKVVFDPRQIVREVQSLFAESARGKGLQLKAEWQGEHTTYQADAHRLRQMLFNLTGNAIKFTAHGQVCIEAAEIERTGNVALLEFAVVDTGMGIPTEKQELLFKPFSQMDSSTTRQFGGTGLGLSIVKNLACLMGGDVGVDSEPGKGSRFWLRIRADVYAGTERRQRGRATYINQTGEQKSPGAPPQLCGSLLVAEDDATNKKVILAMLDSLGLTAVIADNGQQATERIDRGERFDLILMDLHMPVMDGIAATLHIRQRERELSEPHRTIVALTADAFAEDRERCLNAGMDDFLTKPIDIAALSSLLRHWLAPHVTSETAGAEGGRSASAAVPPAPTFVEAALLDPLGDNRELARLIIDSAASDFPMYFDQLVQACQAVDWIAAERPVHIMKGLAAQIGGLKLAGLMQTTEERLKQGEGLDADTLTQLQREYASLTVALEHWLESSS